MPETRDSKIGACSRTHNFCNERCMLIRWPEQNPLPLRHPLGRRLFCLALLVLVAWALRLPRFLNAGVFDSDNAVVGLQARHMLHGEWNWLLWGTGYQSSFDAAGLALAFALFGATPLVMMSATFAAFTLTLWLGFDILARRLSLTRATWCAMLFALGSPIVNNNSVEPPRQWSIAAVFFALWLLDSASRRRLAIYAAGAGFFALALFLDLFTVQFFAGVGAFGLVCCLDDAPDRKTLGRRILACIVGGCVGLLPTLAAHLFLPKVSTTMAGLSVKRLAHNVPLLFETCVPMMIGLKTYVSGAGLYPDFPELAWPLHALQLLGLGGLLVLVAAASARLFSRDCDWPLRRLALLGLITTAAALAGFSFSMSVSDMWSARYLSPIVWLLPFAFAAVAAHWPVKRFALVLLPYLACLAMAGWIDVSPLTAGPRIVRTAGGQGTNERELGEFLRAHDIHAAAAQYWLAYRLAFVLEENPIFIPLDASQDRYAPYRQAFATQARVAYIFHPSEPRARPEPLLQKWSQLNIPFEHFAVAGYDLYLAPP